LTIKQAEKRIKKHITAQNANNQNTKIKVNLILNKLRNINVTLLGAIHSGNYQISCLSTLFNLLYLSGGPDSGNSYRNIKVIRNNNLIQVFDLYEVLKMGILKRM